MFFSFILKLSSECLGITQLSQYNSLDFLQYLFISFVNLFSWSMLSDDRLSFSAWLVLFVFWLYVVVLVVSCFAHWWHIYKRVQLNRSKKEEGKTSQSETTMVRSMFSIRAMERRATSALEITKGSSPVPYMELKDMKVAKRSKSHPALAQERKKNLESNPSTSSV